MRAKNDEFASESVYLRSDTSHRRPTRAPAASAMRKAVQSQRLLLCPVPLRALRTAPPRDTRQSEQGRHAYLFMCHRVPQRCASSDLTDAPPQLRRWKVRPEQSVSRTAGPALSGGTWELRELNLPLLRAKNRRGCRCRYAMVLYVCVSHDHSMFPTECAMATPCAEAGAHKQQTTACVSLLL